MHRGACHSAQARGVLVIRNERLQQQGRRRDVMHQLAWVHPRALSRPYYMETIHLQTG